ncbi:hypothetical protein GCM10027098_31650 [Bowmanella dokdonensis]
MPITPLSNNQRMSIWLRLNEAGISHVQGSSTAIAANPFQKLSARGEKLAPSRRNNLAAKAQQQAVLSAAISPIMLNTPAVNWRVRVKTWREKFQPGG